jgi:hypothetical protein
MSIKSAAVRRPRRRNKQAPLTAHQRALMVASRAQRQATIDLAVSEWYSATLLKANELAVTFNKKPRFFLDLFFQGGARMVHKHKKVNPWNAWMSMQAEKLNAGKVLFSPQSQITYSSLLDAEIGEALHLTDVQDSTKAEYEALTAEDKDALVEEFLARPEKPVRVNARGRILDVMNVVKNMESLVSVLDLI